jgi:hypothetical protein
VNSFIKLFSSQNISILSSWTEEIYFSFEQDGIIIPIEHTTEAEADQWFSTAIDAPTPFDLIDTVDTLGSIAPRYINESHIYIEG